MFHQPLSTNHNRLFHLITDDDARNDPLIAPLIHSLFPLPFPQHSFYPCNVLSCPPKCSMSFQLSRGMTDAESEEVLLQFTFFSIQFLSTHTANFFYLHQNISLVRTFVAMGSLWAASRKAS